MSHTGLHPCLAIVIPNTKIVRSNKKNLTIFEVGISYYGRTYQEGKKIKWYDSIHAAYVILKYNLL